MNHKKPTALKILQGTNQPCRANPDEPMPSLENVKMPKGMRKEAQVYWRKTLPLLQEVRVMTVNDVDALRLYCENMVMIDNCFEKVYEHGEVIETLNDEGEVESVKRNPALQTLRESQTIALAFMREFGMTPSSRTRVSSIGKKKSDAGFNGI